MSEQLAFLGLGIMGSAMAANLVKSGFAIKGWNRTPGKPGERVAADAGVVIERDAHEAVRDADVVFMCLGDEHDLHGALFEQPGLARSLKKGAIVVDMSTTGTKAARDAFEALLKQDVSFLDAPVSGGDVGARNGTLTIMVGGERAAYDRCQPFFEAMGKNIRYCGPSGSGQGVKLCNQVLCAVNMIAVCEAFHLADEIGIDKQLVVDVCGSGAAGSWALSNLGARILKGDFEPAFMIKHMLKDLRLVAESAGGLGELPGTELSVELFDKAVKEKGTAGDEQGTQAMMRAYL